MFSNAYRHTAQTFLSYLTPQQWLFNERRAVLEAGRAAVLHPGPALARAGVPVASGAAAQADGQRYDGNMHPAN